MNTKNDPLARQALADYAGWHEYDETEPMARHSIMSLVLLSLMALIALMIVGILLF